MPARADLLCEPARADLLCECCELDASERGRAGKQEEECVTGELGLAGT